MFAADIILWLLLLYVLRPFRKPKLEISLLYHNAQYLGDAGFGFQRKQGRQRPQPFIPIPPQETESLISFALVLVKTAFLGFAGLCSIVLFARLFRTHGGQCAVEGLTYHGSIFLLIAGILLLRRKNYITAILPLLCGFSIFILGFNMLVVEPYFSLTAEYYTVTSPKITKPLRIVFVSDIQTDRVGWYEHKTLKMIQAQKADLIILGGDYLQYYEGTRNVADLPERFRLLFVEHKLEAPLGVFAIAGNIGSANFFKDTTVEYIDGSTIFENLGADKDKGPIDLVLLGLNDSMGGVGENGLTDTGNFIVMAGHRPNYALNGYHTHKYNISGYLTEERAPDLMLAGHTHGSQLALPFYGPLGWGGDNSSKQIPRKMLCGLHILDNGSKLLVSRGTGMERGWAPRVRLFCRPEISVIDLRGE